MADRVERLNGIPVKVERWWSNPGWVVLVLLRGSQGRVWAPITYTFRRTRAEAIMAYESYAFGGGRRNYDRERRAGEVLAVRARLEITDRRIEVGDG